MATRSLTYVTQGSVDESSPIISVLTTFDLSPMLLIRNRWRRMPSVKTEMASLCGSDLHMVGKGWQMPEYPAPPGHPGHEGVGIVEEPPKRYPDGEGIDILEPGDLVLTVPHIWYAKCFAEYQAVDAAHMLKMPAGAPVEHVLMTQQLGTVIFATQRLPESLEGMTCAVLGAGGAQGCFGIRF